MDNAAEFINDRILVIDDNAEIHRDFRDILELKESNHALESLKADLFGDDSRSADLPGFQVDTVLQGKEGYERVTAAIQKGKPYAVAFVDMRMPPGWDGLETIEHLWRSDPDLEVVICTAYSDHSWEEITRRLGTAIARLLILKKPFDNIEVKQLAHALTQRWQLRKQAKARNEVLEKMVSVRTERLLQETKAHAHSEEKLRAILNATTDLALLVDADGNVLDINERAGKTLGDGAEELVGRRFHEILPADCRETMKERLSEAISIGQSVQFENAHNNLLFDTRIFPVSDAAGQVTSAAVFCRDISRQKDLELQLLQAQKLESIGQLAAGIAHEINTPIQFVGDNVHFARNAFEDISQLLRTYRRVIEDLAGISGREHLLAEMNEAEAKADMAYLQEALPDAFAATDYGITRVSEIVKAMKEFARPDQRQQSLEDLNRALMNTLTIARNEYKYVADVTTDFGELPPVMCHVGDLSQVFLNLIVNAAHAIEAVVGNTGDKGLITVRSRCEGEEVLISICDTGCGVPEVIRSRIFDPFFTTKAVGKGSGQGLAIARSTVVDKHKGSVTFESTVGRGSTFRIRLPVEGMAENDDASL